MTETTYSWNGSSEPVPWPPEPVNTDIADFWGDVIHTLDRCGEPALAAGDLWGMFGYGGFW